MGITIAHRQAVTGSHAMLRKAKARSEFVRMTGTFLIGLTCLVGLALAITPASLSEVRGTPGLVPSLPR